MKTRKLLFVIIIVCSFAIIGSAAENNYVITLQRTNTELSLLDLKFAEGLGPDYIDQPEEGYKALMLSFKGEEMLRFNLSVNEPIIIEQSSNLNLTPQEIENIQNPKTEKIYLNFPYYNNAKKIEILDETGKLKLEIDLSSYARCNENNFCDFNEDIQRCPEDCRKEVAKPQSEQQLQEEAVQEEPAALEETIKEKTLMQKLEEQGISQNLLIIIAVLTIILIIILVLSRKKENK